MMCCDQVQVFLGKWLYWCPLVMYLPAHQTHPEIDKCAWASVVHHMPTPPPSLSLLKSPPAGLRGIQEGVLFHIGGVLIQPRLSERGCSGRKTVKCGVQIVSVLNTRSSDQAFSLALTELDIPLLFTVFGVAQITGRLGDIGLGKDSCWLVSKCE